MLFMFIKFDDSTIKVETFKNPQNVYFKHAISVTRELLQEKTVIQANIYNRKAEVGFADTDAFTFNQRGGIEFESVNTGDEIVLVRFFDRSPPLDG
ncbi:hypothetical protein [Streptomyces chartreusis]